MTTNTKMASHVQAEQVRKNGFADLRTPGLLAHWPIIGLMMFIFGSLVFAGLSYNLVTQGPLLAWDRTLANTLPAIGLKSPPFVRFIMDMGFYTGREVIIVLGVLAGFYFIRKKYWQELAMLLIGMTGSLLLFLSIPNLFARARPPTQIWTILEIPSFPSGHAIAVVTFYGLMAYMLTSKMPSALWKAVVSAAALFIIVFVGFSRIFTGGHYLTDVLSGYAVGIAWSGAVYTLIEIYFQKRVISLDGTQ